MKTTTANDWREDRRLHAWKLKQQGWKQRDIAQALDVTEGAVSQWIRRSRQGGIKALRRHSAPGGAPKLDSTQNLSLLEMLSFGAEAFGFVGDVWTGSRIAALIRHFLGVTYHPGHINRLLRQWGWDRQEALRSAYQNDKKTSPVGGSGPCRNTKKRLLKHSVLQAVAQHLGLAPSFPHTYIQKIELKLCWGCLFIEAETLYPSNLNWIVPA
jgi:transposase